MITTAAPRRLLLLALPTMLLAITCAVYRPPFYARLDDAAYDAVVRSTAARAPAGRIAIVDVDERSLAAVGQWPWRRDVMAG